MPFTGLVLILNVPDHTLILFSVAILTRGGSGIIA